MTRQVRLPNEQAYVRNALFGIELLDGVTLARVSNGVKVVAEGLKAKPRRNTSGVFGWYRGEDFAQLRKVTIDPGVLPFEKDELLPAQLQNPVTRVELRPRVDYPFAAGTTGLRGVLIESRVDPPVPVRDADVHLRWLDEDNVWRDAPTLSRPNQRGDFAAVLRLSPDDVPLLDAASNVTVRLRARRGANERESTDRLIPQGRIADPSTYAQGPDALIFAWDEMQP